LVCRPGDALPPVLPFLLTTMIARELPNERMKRLRTDSGKSLRGLGKEVSMSWAHLWEMESKYDTIMHSSYINLCKIAAALDTDVSKLMAH